MPSPLYYKDKAGEWRWKVTAKNNRRTHASTEGFSSRAKAVENFNLLVDAALSLHSDVETNQLVVGDVLPDAHQPQIPGVDWDK